MVVVNDRDAIWTRGLRDLDIPLPIVRDAKSSINKQLRQKLQGITSTTGEFMKFLIKFYSSCAHLLVLHRY